MATRPYITVMQLLSDKVSTSIASQHFPHLFESSTAQTTARVQPEEEATGSEQATLNDITQTHQDDSQDSFHSAETTTAVYGLERFLVDAEDLAAVLGDNIYTRAISQLRLDARSTLAELTRNKEFIKLQLEKAQEEIVKQRAELDEEERENLRQMQREDDKHRALAGKRLEKALHVLGDLKVASKNANTGLNGMGCDEAVTISDDDSKFDHAEQFEDCSEA
ncbi:hypothetical protein ACKLNR_014572 [Fusarium oxysporum f. sp. zingiberi]